MVVIMCTISARMRGGDIGGSHNVYYQCWDDGLRSMLVVVMMCTPNRGMRGGMGLAVRICYMQGPT